MTASEWPAKEIAGQVCVCGGKWGSCARYRTPTKLNIIACIVPHVDAIVLTVGEGASQTLHVNC